MHRPEYWADKKFSWMKRPDIVPTIKAIQEDARKDLEEKLKYEDDKIKQFEQVCIDR